MKLYVFSSTHSFLPQGKPADLVDSTIYIYSLPLIQGKPLYGHEVPLSHTHNFLEKQLFLFFTPKVWKMLCIIFTLFWRCTLKASRTQSLATEPCYYGTQARKQWFNQFISHSFFCVEMLNLLWKAVAKENRLH